MDKGDADKLEKFKKRQHDEETKKVEDNKGNWITPKYKKKEGEELVSYIKDNILDRLKKLRYFENVLSS